MKLRLLTSAFFSFRNMAMLAVLAGLLYGFETLALWSNINNPDIRLYVYPAGLCTYLAFVLQSFASRKFREEVLKKQKLRHIRELNYTCIRLANEAKKYTNSSYYQKLRRVMEDKNEIMNSFSRGDHSYLKEKIVEQTLNLVIAYIKLLSNFCIRHKELTGADVSEIADRINSNTRKLNFTKDTHIAGDIKSIIEMDEKVIGRLKDEKKDLERISAKLDFMGGTVSMFKHQILSSIESEEMVGKLETVLNEAVALDNVLEDRRRNLKRV